MSSLTRTVNYASTATVDLLAATWFFTYVRPNSRRAGIRDPIFIVGCGHSGTTVLTAILGAHPDVYKVPHESNIFVRPPGAGGATVLGFWLTHKTFSNLNSWYRAAARSNSTVIVEKTPKHVRSMGPLLRLWRDSRVVFVIRDPLDVVASLIRRGWGLQTSIARWLDDNAAALDYLAHPRVTTFRYEHFAEDPATTVRSVLSKLSLKPDPTVLDRFWRKPMPPEPSPAHGRLRQQQTRQPVFDGRGRWRQTLDDETADRVRTELAPLAAQLGY